MSESHDYDELFRQAGPQLWRTVYAYAGGRRAVADDAVAEACARAIQHDGQIRDPLRWLYRVAFRVASQDLRKETAHGEPPDDAESQPHDDGLGPLMAALKQLPHTQRAAILLHYEADLPVREVARRLGTSVGAVKVRLHQGRKRLRILLSEEDVAHS